MLLGHLKGTFQANDNDLRGHPHILFDEWMETSNQFISMKAKWGPTGPG